MKIITPLIVAPQLDGILWQLVYDFNVEDDVLGVIRVPHGFKTDFGSIPQALRNVISPTGRGTWGFTLHDWEYGTQTIVREDADKLLLRWLRFCKEEFIETDAIYDALRVAGEFAWDDDKAKVTENLNLLSAPPLILIGG